MDRAATAFAVAIAEPIPATSEAAAATSSGAITTNAISDLAVTQDNPKHHRQPAQSNTVTHCGRAVYLFRPNGADVVRVAKRDRPIPASLRGFVD
ncbi:hypothetical protein BHQ20_00965 [Mycobacterium intermedium]|nr:hypothetical protein BHQ20_00965 [Mycobacterium intermedium]